MSNRKKSAYQSINLFNQSINQSINRDASLFPCGTCLFPHTIAERRERGDLIEVFKILWEVRKARNGVWLVKDLADNGRRQRHPFFSYRVIQKWNLLPTKVKIAPSLDSFKNRLDEMILTRNKWKTLKLWKNLVWILSKPVTFGTKMKLKFLNVERWNFWIDSCDAQVIIKRM